MRLLSHHLLILSLCFALANPANAQTPTRGGKEQKHTANINLVDGKANEVFDLIEMYSGKKILKRQDIGKVSINFNSRGPIPKEEAILVLESLLSLNGVMLTDMGEDYLIAVNAPDGSKQTPRMLGNELMELPPSQQIFSKLFEINHLNIDNIEAMLGPFLTANGKIDKFAHINAVLITDSLQNLQRVQNILYKIDQPIQMRESIAFVPLKFVAATDILPQIEKMKNGLLRRYLEGSTTIEADERTNQLILITHPENIPVIKEIIESLDKDVAPLTKSEVIPVSNAEATKVAEIIQEIITGQQDAEEESNGRSGANPAANNPAQPRGDIPNPAAPRPSPQSTASNNSSNDSAKLQFSSYVKIVADERSNSIITYGTDADLKQIQELVSKIDVVLAQVRIEVVIAEVTLGEDQVRGIDSFGLDASAFENWTLTNLTGPSSGSLDSAFTIGGSFKDFSLQTVFNTAKSNSNVQILSSPTIMTTHNREASIIVGEQRPIISSTQSDVDSTNTFSSVSFENIGIELTVTPLIGVNGIVQMEIKQSIETVIDTTQIDNNEQPIIGNREASSFVSVLDKNIVILGGLQEVEVSEGRGRIFLLGSLPILEHIFSSKTNSRTVRELIVFIKPTIVSTPNETQEMASERIEELHEGDEIREKLREWKIIETPKSNNTELK